MSSLILPNQWTSQPQYPVQLDRNNPLGAKVVYASTLAGVALDAATGKIGVNTAAVPKATPRGMALNFNGSSAYITLPTTNLVAAYPLTVSCWFERPATTSGGVLYSLNGASYSAIGGFYNLNGGNFITNAGSNPATTGYLHSNFLAGWNHIVVIHRNGSWDLYVNGVGPVTLTVANNWGQPSAGNHSIGNRLNGASPQYFNGGGIQDFIVFRGELSADEAKQVYLDPYQIFKSQSRRIWVAAAGGGDATATITGVSGSGQIGTLSTSGNASVSLPGASGAGSVGNVVASVSAATAITGVNGAGQVGNTTQTCAANVAVSTVAGTGQVGTVSASGIGAPDGNVAITGIAGTGQVGTLAASGNGAVSITGIAATGSVGSVTPSVTVTTTITGAIGTGSVGTTTQTGAANATVSSAVGIGLVGTVSATGTSQDGNAVISGISGIGSVGIVSANDGTVVNNHGFIIIDTEPRLWWKRKPSKLDDKKAEEKIVEVVRTIERVANSIKPSVSKEVLRKAAYAEIAPLLREMPGFDWSPMFRAILTQSKLQEQNRIAAEQAGILAKQEIERIKRIRDDEEALIVLLMGA